MTESVQNASGATDADSRTIGVAVLGMGNVGAEVVRIITDNADDLRARVGAPVEIRGVAVSRGTLDQLIEMGWVRLGRRRQGPGRPVTFVVTEAFLDHFGLSSTRDLPGLAELRAAGLLDPAGPMAAQSGLAHGAAQADIAQDDAPGDDLFGD